MPGSALWITVGFVRCVSIQTWGGASVTTNLRVKGRAPQRMVYQRLGWWPVKVRHSLKGFPSSKMAGSHIVLPVFPDDFIRGHGGNVDEGSPLPSELAHTTAVPQAYG